MLQNVAKDVAIPVGQAYYLFTEAKTLAQPEYPQNWRIDMKTINVSTAKTSDLLAFYNANADKPVNKFTNLETARRRVTALIEALEVSSKAHDAAKAATAAAKLAKSAAKDATKLADAVDKTVAVKTPSAVVDAPTPAPVKQEEAPKPKADASPQARRSNAAGIAASWNDPEVREARLYRQGVVVTVGKRSQEFTSTHAAFDALGLPTSKVIRFRMKLKEAKKLTFTHAGKDFEFSIL